MSLVFHDFIQVSSTESMRVHKLPYPYQFNVFIAMWKIIDIYFWKFVTLGVIFFYIRWKRKVHLELRPNVLYPFILPI